MINARIVILKQYCLKEEINFDRINSIINLSKTLPKLKHCLKITVKLSKSFKILIEYDHRDYFKVKI